MSEISDFLQISWVGDSEASCQSYHSDTTTLHYMVYFREDSTTNIRRQEDGTSFQIMIYVINFAPKL
jgi:hypothetical protein